MALAIGIFSLFHHTPRLMWNASASTPVGLYSLHPAGELRSAISSPTGRRPALSRFMAERHYLPLGVPLLKYVGALPGQTVCRHGLQVSVDGLASRDRRSHAIPPHRPLPVWQGCHTLKPDEIFLLNPAVPELFRRTLFWRGAAQHASRRAPCHCGRRARNEPAGRTPPNPCAGAV